jgi:hypothetical protein
MKYVRKWACAICYQAVIIDTKLYTQKCGCNFDKETTLEEHERIKTFLESPEFLLNYQVLCV